MTDDNTFPPPILGSPLHGEAVTWLGDAPITYERQWMCGHETEWIPDPCGRVYHHRKLRYRAKLAWYRFLCWWHKEYFYLPDWEDETYTDDMSKVGTVLQVPRTKWKPIPGATGESYVLTEEDRGEQICCVVTATNNERKP